MHKCGKRWCNCEIEDNYRFCYEHRNTPYKDICKIHGEQTFIAGKCQKCKALKRGIYRIYKRNGKYYFNRSRTPIDKDSEYYFLKPYFTLLTNKSKTVLEKHATRISKTPGIYGIFVRNRNKKNQLGKCLYIGQSVNVFNRTSTHKKHIAAASNQIKGARAQSKKKYKDWKKIIPPEKRKQENKYYYMAKYYLKDLKFVQLMKIDEKYWKSLNDEQQKILLCMLEQYAIDVYCPQTNTFASRASYN